MISLVDTRKVRSSLKFLRALMVSPPDWKLFSRFPSSLMDLLEASHLTSFVYVWRAYSQSSAHDSDFAASEDALCCSRNALAFTVFT